MTKSLVFSAFLALLMMYNGLAAAQDTPSEMPSGNNAAAAVKKLTPAGAYNLGVGPINLQPRYYVGNKQTTQKAANTSAGRLSYPVQDPNSAAAYNQRLVKAQAATQRKKNSVIPSPFPDNF
ncbi:MAG TPA: hypothetical protein VIN59_04995 [Alphaproteobacteria bacterium]